MNKRLRVAAAFIVLAAITLSGCRTTAPTTSPPAVELLEFGTYAAQPVGIVESPDTPTGTTIQATGFTLVEATDQVQIEKETVFGITVVLDDSRYKSIEVNKIIRHPPMIDPYRNGVFTVSESTKILAAGVPAHHGYMLEEEFEMLPGEGTFEFWHDNQLLCEKTFTLYD